MAEDEGSFVLGLAYLLRKRMEARMTRCRKDFTKSKIAFWKKHLARVENRIEELEASLPRKPKKKMSSIQIE